MNCYFTCQKLSKFSKTCFTTTKETALAPFNLAHLVHLSSPQLSFISLVTFAHRDFFDYCAKL